MSKPVLIPYCQRFTFCNEKLDILFFFFKISVGCGVTHPYRKTWYCGSVLLSALKSRQFSAQPKEIRTLFVTMFALSERERGNEGFLN